MNTPIANTTRTRRRDFSEVVAGYGFMTDRQIKAALQEGYLIDPGTFDLSSVRHASYTLRLGRRIEVAAAARANTEVRRDFNVQEIGVGEFIELQPGDTAKLYSLEVLDLPHDVLAFTVARGLLFIESLVPENTYADPGFRDSLYTTVTNLSHRTVKMQYGAPIARIFFYRLEENVEESFRQGTAIGIDQRLQSSRFTPFGTQDECNGASTVELLKTIRHIPLAGASLYTLMGRQERYMFLLAVGIVLWPTLLLLANRSTWLQAKLGDIVVNLVASVIFALLIAITNALWRKRQASNG